MGVPERGPDPINLRMSRKRRAPAQHSQTIRSQKWFNVTRTSTAAATRGQRSRRKPNHAPRRSAVIRVRCARRTEIESACHSLHARMQHTPHRPSCATPPCTACACPPPPPPQPLPPCTFRHNRVQHTFLNCEPSQHQNARPPPNIIACSHLRNQFRYIPNGFYS